MCNNKAARWFIFALALWAALLGDGCGGTAAPPVATLGGVQPQPEPQPQPQPQPREEPEFTVVLLPDTQYYSEQARASMEMLLAEMRRIAENKDRETIRAVIGLGDLVQCND